MATKRDVISSNLIVNIVPDEDTYEEMQSEGKIESDQLYYVGGEVFTPSASVSKVGSVATITITDKEGTTTATITDGTNGTNGTNGVTPNIDATTKHWMIGGIDTGIVAEGRDGEDGEDGAPGAPGAPGAAGKTAYASAVDGGYTGTEAQFNSDLAAVGGKQNATDNNLPTTSKTVVGAIGELKENKVDQAQGTGKANKWLGTDASGNIDTKDLPIAGVDSLGIISINEAYGYAVLPNGNIFAKAYNSQQFANLTQEAFISKSTLENIANARGWTIAIKTTMDAVAVANAHYYLGQQSAVSVVLPSTASAGQIISVVFYSGSTAATLSITGTTIGDVVTPSANQRVELNILYDGAYWAILSNTMSVTV